MKMNWVFGLTAGITSMVAVILWPNIVQNHSGNQGEPAAEKSLDATYRAQPNQMVDDFGNDQYEIESQALDQWAMWKRGTPLHSKNPSKEIK